MSLVLEGDSVIEGWGVAHPSLCLQTRAGSSTSRGCLGGSQERARGFARRTGRHGVGKRDGKVSARDWCILVEKNGIDACKLRSFQVGFSSSNSEAVDTSKLLDIHVTPWLTTIRQRRCHRLWWSNRNSGIEVQRGFSLFWPIDFFKGIHDASM